MATLRLFVALWPSPATRNALAAVQRALRWPAEARPVSADALHLTLAFIGMVPHAQLAEVGRSTHVASARVHLVLDRLEVWKGGTAVLRPSAVPAALADLHGRVVASLRAHGVPFDERAFVPHVTLARKARGVEPGSVPQVQWRSAGHVLVSSAGGRYSVVARFA